MTELIHVDHDNFLVDDLENDIEDDSFKSNVQFSFKQSLRKINNSFPTSERYSCLIATVFGFVGGLMIFFAKNKQPIARQYGLQSIIINGLCSILASLCAFGIILFDWFLYILLIVIVIMVLFYITQIGIALYSKGERFIGIPKLKEWVQEKTKTSLFD